MLKQRYAEGWWLVASLLIGIVSASQSIYLTIALLGIITFAALVSITPLAAFTIMLVLAPLRTLIATESPFQLPLDIGQITAVTALGAWVAHRVVRHQPLLRIGWTPLFVPIGVFAVVAGLTVFPSVHISSWLSEWLKWLIILALIAMALSLGAGLRWQWLVAGLVAGAAANAIVGLYIFFGGSGAYHLLVGGRFFRAFGTFGQPNPFGGYLGMIAPLALMACYAYALRSWRLWRIGMQMPWSQLGWLSFYGGALALMLSGLLASWSRGAWLGFVLAMTVVAFAIPRRLWISFSLAGAVMALVLGAWLGGILPASVVQRVASSTEEFFAFDDVRGVDITPQNFAVVERLAHWQAALNMTESNPFLGVGLGHYEVTYDQYRLLNWHEPLGHAHNYYLNILAEAGIIGFLVYLVLWLSVFVFTWRARQHPDTLARSISIGLLGTWTYLSFHSLLDNLYVNNLFLHIGVMLGVLAVIYQQTWQTTRPRSL